jgi:hypothetical protein
MSRFSLQKLEVFNNISTFSSAHLCFVFCIRVIQSNNVLLAKQKHDQSERRQKLSLWVVGWSVWRTLVMSSRRGPKMWALWVNIWRTAMASRPSFDFTFR